MLSSRIKTLSSKAATSFVRHYINPGDDPSLTWEGVPDDNGFYSYKYSNQWSTEFKRSDLVGHYYFSARLFAIVPTGSTTSTSGVVNATFEFTIAEDDIYSLGFVRFPRPDVPAAVMVTFQNAKIASLVPATVPMTFREIKFFGYSLSTVLIPIFDPNWKRGSELLIEQQIDIRSYGPSVSSAISKMDPGMGDNFTAYRLVGASMTIENVTAPLYKDGSFYTGNISAPYVPFKEDGGPYQDIAMVTHDYPTSATQLTSFMPYHVFNANEGAYVVCRTCSDNFDYKNIRTKYSTVRPGGLARAFDGSSFSSTFWPCMVNEAISANNLQLTSASTSGLVNYTDNWYTASDSSVGPLIMPFVYKLTSAPDSAEKAAEVCPIIPNITSEQTDWTTAFVFPLLDWTHAQLRLKFNSYCECLCGIDSVLKPNITKSALYDGEAFRLIRDFYAKYDGVYPAAWNANNRLTAALTGLLRRAVFHGQISVRRPQPKKNKAGKAPQDPKITSLKSKLHALAIRSRKAGYKKTDQDEALIQEGLNLKIFSDWDTYRGSIRNRAGRGKGKNKPQPPPAPSV